MQSIRLQHYDTTSCKQRHLIVKHYWCIGVSICYNHRKFGKVSSINEGEIAFSKKVHVFLRHPVYITNLVIFRENNVDKTVNQEQTAPEDHSYRVYVV